MASSTMRGARWRQSVVWAKKRAVSAGDQNSGFEMSFSWRIGGGSFRISISDPDSPVSSLDSFSSLSSSSTGLNLRAVRLCSSCWRRCCCCDCGWFLEVAVRCGGENFRLISGYLFSFAPLTNRPLLRTSLLGELALLVDGVRSESSSVGVVEFWPETITTRLLQNPSGEGGKFWQTDKHTCSYFTFLSEIPGSQVSKGTKIIWIQN